MTGRVVAVRAAAVVLVAGMSLAGCSGESDTAASPSASASAKPSAHWRHGEFTRARQVCGLLTKKTVEALHVTEPNSDSACRWRGGNSDDYIEQQVAVTEHLVKPPPPRPHSSATVEARREFRWRHSGGVSVPGLGDEARLSVEITPSWYHSVEMAARVRNVIIDIRQTGGSLVAPHRGEVPPAGPVVAAMRKLLAKMLARYGSHRPAPGMSKAKPVADVCGLFTAAGLGLPGAKPREDTAGDAARGCVWVREHGGSTSDSVTVHVEAVPKLPGFSTAGDAAKAVTAGWASKKGVDNVAGLGDRAVLRSDLRIADLAVRRGNLLVVVAIERSSKATGAGVLRTQATKIARTVLRHNG